MLWKFPDATFTGISKASNNALAPSMTLLCHNATHLNPLDAMDTHRYLSILSENDTLFFKKAQLFFHIYSLFLRNGRGFATPTLPITVL